MSKLVNKEGKNKLNKTYELFENSVKELNKLISYKTLDEYNVFLGFLKGRKNSFDKAVGEAIDAVYVKGILDEEDIITGCPTDIVKFNKDYKTSKTKELIEAGLVNDDIKLGKKNIIEDTVENNKTKVKLTKDATYREYILSQINATKNSFNKFIDDFSVEVEDSNNGILNTMVDKSIITASDKNSTKFISEKLLDSSYVDELFEPLRKLMEIDMDGIIVDGDKITVSPSNILSYLISSVLCKQTNNTDIILQPNEINMSGKKIKDTIVSDLYDTVLRLIGKDHEQLCENVVEKQSQHVNMIIPQLGCYSYSTEENIEYVNKTDKGYIINIDNKVNKIEYSNDKYVDAVNIISKILEMKSLNTEYAISVLSNYSNGLLLNIITGLYDDFKLSQLQSQYNILKNKAYEFINSL